MLSIWSRIEGERSIRETATEDVAIHLVLYAVGYLIGACLPYRRVDWRRAPARLMRQW